MKNFTRVNSLKHMRAGMMFEWLICLMLVIALTAGIFFTAGYFVGKAMERKHCIEIIERLYEEEKDAELYGVLSEIQ